MILCHVVWVFGGLMSCEDMKHYFPVVFFMKHEIFKKICRLYLMYTVNYVVCTTVVICFNLCSLAVGFSHYIFRKILCLSGLVTAVAVFRNPNTIRFCLTTDLLLKVFLSCSEKYSSKEFALWLQIEIKNNCCVGYIIYCVYTTSKSHWECTNLNLSSLSCCLVFQSNVAMVPYFLYFTAVFRW
jgi:hypothetical protein